MALVAAVGAGACKKMSADKDPGKKTEQPGSGSAGGPSPATGPILIGHFASLTGSEATFGTSTDEGIRLAINERNAAGGVGGRQVSLTTLDTASNEQQSGTVVTRLISSDKVVALLGEVASGNSLAGARVAQPLGVPMISPSSTNLQVTEVGDMIFRVCFTDDFQAWVVAKFLRDELKLDKVGVLYAQDSTYSKGLAEDFRKSFVKLGGAIAGDEAYTSGNQDVSAQLQNIKTAGAQALFLPGYYTDAGTFMQAAKKMGLTIPFIGADGWDSSELVKIAGDAIEGHYYSNHYATDEARPEVADFVAKYKAAYKGKTPDGLAALGYDAARVLMDAMARAKSLGGADLAAAIAATKDFPGVTGSITIDENRNAKKKAVVVQVTGGVAHLKASIWPEGMTPPASNLTAGSGAAAVGSAAGSGSGEHGLGGGLGSGGHRGSGGGSGSGGDNRPDGGKGAHGSGGGDGGGGGKGTGGGKGSGGSHRAGSAAATTPAAPATK